VTLFDPVAPASPLTLARWAERFTDEQKIHDDRPVLVGYSLGGRLALHALLHDPGAWRGAILISTHPGLADAAARAERLADDAIWAERFARADWETTVARWNAQAVFSGGGPCPIRVERAFSRTCLAEGLTAWSLGSQADLRERLPQLGLPILWIAGERDTKFTALAREAASFSPRAEWQTIAEAGHRVLFDNPEGLARAIDRFLEKRVNNGNMDTDQRVRGCDPGSDRRRHRQDHDQPAPGTQCVPATDGDRAAGSLHPRPR
jgi:2-succinyl-6-hydroxy-2,4-cyclohexadiene-1-carboxylate synthase